MTNPLKNNGYSLRDQLIRNQAVSRIITSPQPIVITSIANALTRGGASHAIDHMPLSQRPSMILETTGGGQ